MRFAVLLCYDRTPAIRKPGFIPKGKAGPYPPGGGLPVIHAKPHKRNSTGVFQNLLVE